MTDLEWPMLLYYVIYYEKFIKVTQRTEKEALIFTINPVCFNRIAVNMSISMPPYFLIFSGFWWIEIYHPANNYSDLFILCIMMR